MARFGGKTVKEGADRPPPLQSWPARRAPDSSCNPFPGLLARSLPATTNGHIDSSPPHTAPWRSHPYGRSVTITLSIYYYLSLLPREPPPPCPGFARSERVRTVHAVFGYVIIILLYYYYYYTLSAGSDRTTPSGERRVLYNSVL